MQAPLISHIGIPKRVDELNKLLEKEKQKIKLSGLIGSAYSVFASATVREITKPHLFIFTDKEAATYFINDLEILLQKKVFFFPCSYRRPYHVEETDNSNVLQRAEVLNKINRKKNPIIVTYSEALTEKVVARKELNRNTINISKNVDYSIDKIESNFEKLNFEKSDFVTEPGQYSIRGGIIDVFSFANEFPYRIEFNDSKIESIRTFNINSQLSITQKNKIQIVPNTEARKEIKHHESFLDYLPNKSIIWTENIDYTKNIINDFFDKAKKEYLKISKNSLKYLKPEDLFTKEKKFIKKLQNFSVIEKSKISFFNSEKTLSFNTISLTNFNKNFELLKDDLLKNENNGIKNIILCSSKEQESRLNAILANYKNKFFYKCIQLTLKEGFIDKLNKIAVYTDHQIFDRHHKFKSKIKTSNKHSITIKEINSLSKGDYVTHIDHGIGKFEGLYKISNNGIDQEVIKLSYKGGDILYTSIHALHKIAKFSAKEGTVPNIHQLGSPKWKLNKNKVKTNIKKIAFDLIKLYAQRKHKKGFSFSPDNYLQHELEASFIYEDTPDQTKCTEDVKNDMENITPMDRLICGDVGFGKTEIAIRAAFKAVCDNKQVAILVPTTILALQHYKTFKKRLANFPCTIDYISRFKNKKEQKLTAEKISKGKIDILIGTHRIVGKDINFLDLGLLIIDEEQKFGVNIKDKIKLIKESIDTLTLSATPIPRTLQFSLLGARDLSIINTPPPNRQSIETKIIVMNEEIIRDTISYEVSRNGQVYFVHNRIENINEVAGLLQRLCPDLKIRVGHGQMKGNELENLMIDFIEGDFDVLVSTTIIENGVDVPNANTIIINNAHNFGLSDLHQMRGRVGRSNKKAFCTLISPPLHTVSSESRKRLRALEQFSTLGSGFKIAMRDLDIRGAGDLLGADQSGFINNMGFETYQKILNEAIEELKEEKFNDLFKGKKSNLYLKECQLDTDLEILIPEDYVSNTNERLNLYKEINTFKTEEEITQFSKRLTDRFGPAPKIMFNLFSAIRLKWSAKKIGFEKIILKNKKMTVILPDKEKESYYNSSLFQNILKYLNINSEHTLLEEKNNKLYLKIKEVNKIQKALEICTEILS